jgi:hypothetical protein
MVHVDSEPGRGTTMKVYFPAADRAVAAPAFAGIGPAGIDPELTDTDQLVAAATEAAVLAKKSLPPGFSRP